MPYHLDQINSAKTVMIVVDMQNDFVAKGAKLQSAAAAAMVPKLASTLNFCREKGIRVIYTAHVHRRDGSDMGLYDDLYSPIADRSTLVDGTKGVEIFSGLAPAAGEHIIKKHRYSAFFGTDLDLILREWGITTVIISGTTTENCCHATARDAMFNNYKVVFLSERQGRVSIRTRAPCYVTFDTKASFAGLRIGNVPPKLPEGSKSKISSDHRTTFRPWLRRPGHARKHSNG